MSWQHAKKEALRIVERLNLKNSEINGQKFQLEDLMKGNNSTGRYRVMVMQAVHRIMEGRGARTDIAKQDVKRKRPPGEK